MEDLLVTTAVAIIPVAITVAAEWIASRRARRKQREIVDARTRAVAATIRADMHVSPTQLAIIGPNDLKRLLEFSIAQRQSDLENMEVEVQK